MIRPQHRYTNVGDMNGLLPLLETGLTEVQVLGTGFAVGVAIAILGYLVYEATNKPPG